MVTGLPLQHLDMQRQSPKATTITITNPATTIQTIFFDRKFSPFEGLEFSGLEGSLGRILGTCSEGGEPIGGAEGGDAGGDERTVVLNGFPALLHNDVTLS